MRDSDPLSWMDRKGRCMPAAGLVFMDSPTVCQKSWRKQPPASLSGFGHRLGRLPRKACDVICVARAQFRLSLAPALSLVLQTGSWS